MSKLKTFGVPEVVKTEYRQDGLRETVRNVKAVKLPDLEEFIKEVLSDENISKSAETFTEVDGMIKARETLLEEIKK